MNSRFLVIATFIALAANIAPASAVPVNYFDGTFADASWATQQFLNGNVSAFQVANGGNPNAFRETDHSNLNTGQSIIVIDLTSGAIYDPVASGAISSIDYSFDLKFLGGTAGTSQVGYRLALEQAGSLYFSTSLGIASGPGGGLPSANWASFAFSGLTAADFLKQSGLGALDFSATGTPISFGYLTTNTVNADSTGTQSGIDNWSVTVTPVATDNTGVPEPVTLSLFGAGLAGAVAMRRRKKKSA